jgi:hypothetical protein
MGNDPAWTFPVMRNFCNKLFQRLPTPPLTLSPSGDNVTLSPQPHSGALLQTTATYLKANDVSFDPRFLAPIASDSFSSEDLKNSPVEVFCRLEEQLPEIYNIERLCEFTWRVFGKSHVFWESFIYEGIYFKLFALFTQQFGMGLGRAMQAGYRVITQLAPGDVVLNLNYDILFDLALVQSGKPFCYAPEVHPGMVSLLKPHGSINLYVNLSNGNCFFEEPHRIHGSVRIPDRAGGTFSPYGGILPPRLNKSYEQQPFAEHILSTGRPFLPRVVTFWGVGLTASDQDLLSLYKEATAWSKIIEFINPDEQACRNAEKMLGKRIRYFSSLDKWFAAYGIPDYFADLRSAV